MRERRHGRYMGSRRTPSSSRWRCRGSPCSAPRATPGRSAASAATAPRSSTSTDPATQPWVTSVGGTSFEGDNPGANPNPGAPAEGHRDGLERRQSLQRPGGRRGQRRPGRLFLVCRDGRRRRRFQPVLGPSLDQRGPGVNTLTTTYSGETVANGETACTLAKPGTPCREAPDISANAYLYTGLLGVLHGQRQHPLQLLRAAQRQRAGPRLVRDRRHQPVVSALGRADRRPRQLQRAAGGQHQPVGVLLVRHRPR